MGVPKFYRWISERYPNINQVINDDQIPDFDNFYLDMNGIIHTCSHSNEDKNESNATEEEIFRNIFHYLDFLFRMIKPKKVFFMAVDGVAPRAKMNQQRSRRFRSGKERTRKLKSLAETTGKTFEETAASHFDTNAITPGTQFMANLDEQLRYFVHIKLTTDPLWENVDVHFSGHLTPGEGEHKIMDYIRYTRSQPGYDINTRHCLYGLDADLIMLGLVTHEMHFTLLREEVKYASKKTSKILAPDDINWHLLYTSILRDYIDLEFRSMRDKLQFPYNLDRIVDDWILMAYLVGNDFIPHLPHIHINEEALSILWDTYKKILPQLDGYMNESGELNLPRFEIYLTELAKYDHQRYADENDSFKHLGQSNRSKTKSQSENDGFDLAVLDKLTELSTKEKPDSTLDQMIAVKPKSPDLVSSSDDKDFSSSSSTISNESDDDEENVARKRPIIRIHQDDMDNMPLIEAEFRQHKNHYYRNKMRIDLISTDQLQLYVNQYIEALQWVLKYYYQGCSSWSWFYPHHYAPYLSDLRNFKDLNIKFEKGTPFKPFEQLLSVLPPTSRHLLPDVLQPLMIDLDSPLLHFYPENFQLDQNEKKQDWEAIVLLPFIEEELLLSSIEKYYKLLQPTEQIRNQHIPSLCFTATAKLQPIGDSLAANPYFPPLTETRATSREFLINDYEIKHGRFDEKKKINYPKTPILNVLSYKFGYRSSAVNIFQARSKTTTLVLSLNHRPDADCITYNDQWNAKDENPSSLPIQIFNIQLLIERYLGKRVFVNWPHFQSGIVCAISDFRNVYAWSNIPGGSHFYSEPVNTTENQDFRNYVQTPTHVSYYPFEVSTDNRNNKKAIPQIFKLNELETQMEYMKALNINRQYENHQGISIGPIPILLYVSPLIGYSTKCVANSEKCRTTMYFSNQALAYPLQTTVFKLPNYRDDSERIPQTINDYFKINEPIFALQSPYYSSLGYVEQINRDDHGKYRVSCRMEASDLVNQPDLHHLAGKLHEHQLNYYTAQQVADRLKTAPYVVAKITGKVNVLGSKKRRQRVNATNVGFSWKMNKPVKQLYGYTKKINEIWHYTDAAVSLVSEYMTKFPDITSELEKKPKDDNYYEANIWPEKNGKHQLQQVRSWIKSLPTYSISLMDGAWYLLDEPVIQETKNAVQSFYTKQAGKNVTKKTKTISLDPSHLFKANEFLGLCDPDMTTTYEMLDRVVNVRLDTGVPIGTRGTVIGIMHGQTCLDAAYEILFDHLSSNCLETILLEKNQRKWCIKVRSCQLLNYSHSLRMRSMNYQQQRSIPSAQTHRSQQPSSYTKNQSNENRIATNPKSAPPMTTHDRPVFVHNQGQTSTVSNPSFFPPPTQNSAAASNNTAMPREPSSSFNATSSALFSSAIQGSQQTTNPLQQASGFPPQVWKIDSSQYPQNPLFDQNMHSGPSYPLEQQSSPQFLGQQNFQYGRPPFNPMGFDGYTGTLLFPPYELPPPGTVPISPGRPMGTLTHVSLQQQVPNVPPRSPSELALTSTLSYDAPPFEPQQTASPRPTERETLECLPSQVLPNNLQKP